MTIKADSLLLACEKLGITEPRIIKERGAWWADFKTLRPFEIVWRLARLDCYGWSAFALDPVQDLDCYRGGLFIRVSGPASMVDSDEVLNAAAEAMRADDRAASDRAKREMPLHEYLAAKREGAA